LATGFEHRLRKYSAAEAKQEGEAFHEHWMYKINRFLGPLSYFYILFILPAVYIFAFSKTEFQKKNINCFQAQST